MQVDNSKDLVVMMPIYNLIEYSSDNYSQTSRSLWQYYKDFKIHDIRNSESFEFKEKTQESLFLLVVREALK